MTIFPHTKTFITLNGRAADGRQQFNRASQVAVSVTFYNYSGEVVSPASAKLYMTYRSPNDGCKVSASYDLTQSDSVWSYTWDSSVSDQGLVSCHVESATPTYSADFQFRLLANDANMTKFGDMDCSYR